MDSISTTGERPKPITYYKSFNELLFYQNHRYHRKLLGSIYNHSFDDILGWRHAGVKGMGYKTSNGLYPETSLLNIRRDFYPGKNYEKCE